MFTVLCRQFPSSQEIFQWCFQSKILTWNEETGWLELLGGLDSLDPQWPRETTSNEAGLQLQNPKNNVHFDHFWWFSFVKRPEFQIPCVCFCGGMPYKYISRSLGWEIIVKFLQHLISVFWTVSTGIETEKCPISPMPVDGQQRHLHHLGSDYIVYHDGWSMWFFISFRMQRNDFVTPKPRNKRETAIYTPCTYTVCLFG